MFNLAHAAPKFKLQPIDFYFTDPRVQGLLQAALDGDQATARQWVSQGANPNEEGPMTTPYNRLRLLHYGIAAENESAVRILVALGADPELDRKGSSAGSPLLFTVTLQNPRMLAVLLDLRPVNTLSDNSREDLLFRAANLSTTDCLEVLLQRGFPIDIKDSLGRTALIDVLSKFDFDRAEWLIQRGAQVDFEDRGGVTPAYMIQDDLSRVKPGSESEQKLLNLKAMMQARGAVFPAATPAENRTKRGLTR